MPPQAADERFLNPQAVWQMTVNARSSCAQRRELTKTREKQLVQEQKRPLRGRFLVTNNGKGIIHQELKRSCALGRIRCTLVYLSLFLEPVTFLNMAAPEHVLDQSVKACTKCRRFKRHDEFNRDKQKTDGRASNCKGCEQQRCTKYRQNNRHIWQRHYQNNEKAYKARARQRRIDHPEERLINEQNRRAAKKQALPSWAKTKAMQAEFKRIAQHRQWLNETTGLSHDIDHIVPLQSDFVCGLHVPWNLMILPKKDNNSKNAYWWPGQLDCQAGRGKSHQWWRELQHDVENGLQ